MKNESNFQPGSETTGEAYMDGHSIKFEKKFILVILALSAIGISSFIILQAVWETSSNLVMLVLSFVLAVMPLTLKSFRVIWESSAKVNVNKNSSTFDILTYGHSGSGKTEIIKELFTFGSTESTSTLTFDYYDFQVPLHLERTQKKNLIDVKIADYRGQDCTQMYEAAKENHEVNALLFIVDIAPAYVNGKKYKDEEIIFMFSNDPETEIKKRVFQHYKYINEFSMRAVFKYSYSETLKSVRLIINKIDLLQELQRMHYLEPSLDIHEYARSFFAETIEHLEKYCKDNDITDFKVITTSATRHINVREMFGQLLEVHLKNRRTVNHEGNKCNRR